MTGADFKQFLLLIILNIAAKLCICVIYIYGTSKLFN